MKYCIQVYTGQGKGKTSAAIGSAIRMAGSGAHVVMARFLKTENSSELALLYEIENITVCPITKNFGFTFRMTSEQKAEAKQYYTQLFMQAVEVAKEQSAQMLILDEFNCVYASNLIDREKSLAVLRKHKGSMEMILTGRNAADELMELADYVTVFQKQKHPYDTGLMARKGIEY
ncbi:MAG: cob(I)yrinic acid a,c-diamide adenosyltransferase [Lachnospiraceae bacterium]